MAKPLSKEGKFFIYCFEIYKSAKGMTGKEAVALFIKYKITAYIYAYYEALHTTGDRYIISDIDLYLKERAAEN